MKPAARAGAAARAVQLQRKIFTRWVNQKIVRRGISVEDIVTHIGDGAVLIALMEALSEKKYNGKPLKTPSTMRVHKIDNVNNVLNFIWYCGVESKVKPSAENLVDGEEKSILGLIWAIMDKFLKNVDEETGEQLNIKDGLLKFFRGQLANYKDVSIDNVSSSFHNGLALCALIHKFRPELIDYEHLPRNDHGKTLQIALDAAERAFGLEKYVTPDDIPVMNESSMVVYLNDYYYGIAAWRKMDQSASRISKLIKTTRVNDALKTEYMEKANGLIRWTDAAQTYLSDKSIDYSLEGAQKRLADFYDFKSRGNVNMLQLKLESLYNNLTIKLLYNHRPEFRPEAGLLPKELESRMKQLNVLYQDKRLHLHNELNKQIRLFKLDEQHKTRSQKLMDWLKQKEVWLQIDSLPDGVHEAQMLIRKLDSFEKESDRIYKSSFSVQSRDIEEEMKALRIMFAGQRQHFQKEVQKVKHKHLMDELEERMPKTEAVKTVVAPEPEAEKQFFVSSKSSITLKDIGNELEKERYDKAAEVRQREDDIEKFFNALWEVAKLKRPIFEKHLELEFVKEKLRVELARVASEFLLWAKDAVDRVDSDTNFGFTLSEMDASQISRELDLSDIDLVAEANERQNDYKRVINKLKEFGERESNYIAVLTEMEGTRKAIDAAIKDRRKRYDDELVRQKEIDALCRQFAQIAEDLYKWIIGEIEQLSGSSDKIEDRLKRIVEQIGNSDEKKKVLQTVSSLSDKLTGMGVHNNPHTTLSFNDLVMQWDQFTEFLNQKKSAIEEQILVSKYKGVTPDQIREIEASFAQYDTNKDGFVDKKELKQCLYSLGEEKEMSEIEKIMTEFGSGNGQMNLDKFKEMMITAYGDTGTQEEVITSFEMLSKGDELLNIDMLKRVMTEQDMQYIISSAANSEKGLDFKKWTAEMFSR